MSARIQMGEYESEPIRGLPEDLPDGEQILWQGAPSWRGLARRAFHVPLLSGYFALLVSWRALTALTSGEPGHDAAISLAVLVALALAALGLLVGIAWLNGRATVYTITNRRVVIRFGVALTMAVNLPFRVIQSAALKPFGDGTGDIALSVRGAEQIGFLMLWPFVRPWRFSSDVQPLLRAVPEAGVVSEILARALAASAEWPAQRAQEIVQEAGRPLSAVAAAS